MDGRRRSRVDPGAGAVLESVPCQGSRGWRLRWEVQVARSCEICGKRPVHGNRISHAHNVSSRVWYPNIQKVRAVVGRTSRRIKVCTRCLRSGAVLKPAS